MSDLDKTILIDPANCKADFGKCPVCGQALEPDWDQPDALRCPACRYVKKQEIVIAPGHIIGNKYRVLSLFNSGGCGNLYMCHPLTDASVRYVLKVLKKSNNVSQKRFRREATLLASIEHNERIAKIVDYWESHNDTFIVMEYIKGKNLSQLKQEYTFDEEVTLKIAKEAAVALQYIWENYSIIHRDIKPENIMLDESFHLKLLDFGLSKQCSNSSMSDMITMDRSCLGTPGYMSPEQFKDFKNADFRTDIFSLGATMFFLLTGQKPFRGTTLEDIYQETMNNAPPPPEKFNGTCSPECIRLISKMMQFDPASRHSSYGELLDEIDMLRK